MTPLSLYPGLCSYKSLLLTHIWVEFQLSPTTEKALPRAGNKQGSVVTWEQGNELPVWVGSTEKGSMEERTLKLEGGTESTSIPSRGNSMCKGSEAWSFVCERTDFRTPRLFPLLSKISGFSSFWETDSFLSIHKTLGKQSKLICCQGATALVSCIFTGSSLPGRDDGFV